MNAHNYSCSALALLLAGCAAGPTQDGSFVDESAGGEGWELAVSAPELDVWASGAVSESILIPSGDGLTGALRLAPTAQLQLEVEVRGALGAALLMIPAELDGVQAEVDGLPVSLQQTADGAVQVLDLSTLEPGLYTILLQSPHTLLSELGLTARFGQVGDFELSSLAERGIPQGVLGVLAAQAALSCPASSWSAAIPETLDWLEGCGVSAAPPPASTPKVDTDGDGFDVTADCDDTDAAVGGPQTWYYDGDYDFYGSPLVAYTSCSRPYRYRANALDCDDASATINPKAAEVCDGVDNDCDGTADGAGAADAQTWYYDGDYDFYGDPAVSYTGCTRPSRYRTNSLDCNDADASVGAPQTWYYDGDYDFYGDPAVSYTGCTRPSRYRTNGLDCNDASAAINPKATEVADGVDNDCDGAIDE